jgi:hypothetical protein
MMPSRLAGRCFALRLISPPVCAPAGMSVKNLKITGAPRARFSQAAAGAECSTWRRMPAGEKSAREKTAPLASVAAVPDAAGSEKRGPLAALAAVALLAR